MSIIAKLSGKLEALLRPLLKAVLPRLLFEKLTFFLRLGYWPNLTEPRSFNEKISFRKLNEAALPRPELVDKLAVRDFIEKRIGPEYLTEVLGIYASGDSVNLTELPVAFALKCNTGSGMNRIVPNTEEESEEALNRLVLDWCSSPYSKRSHTYECIYDATVPQVFAEELLQPLESYREYKFWCFGGNPKFVQVQLQRGYHIFYPDGNPAEFCVFNPAANKVLQAMAIPEQLPRLVALAQKLAEGFDFVRVDLVVSGDSRITFSELTFHPGGGRVRFFPRKKDFELGALMPLWSVGPENEHS